VLGGELDLDIWNKIHETKDLPEYLGDLEIETGIGRQLRSANEAGLVPAEDTHLLEQNLPLDPMKKDDIDNQEEFLEDFPKNITLNALNRLHANNLLTTENLTLQDIPNIMRQNINVNDVPADSGRFLENFEEEENGLEDPEPLPVMVVDPVGQNDPAAVDVRNILPERTRGARRRVRFQLPTQ
jgi:hypothetical protein